MIMRTNNKLSIRRQSELLSLNRSSLYMKYANKDSDNELCNLIAEIYSEYPMYGYRRIRAMLIREGISINHKKVSRLMNIMNIRAIYPGPNTSKKALQAKIYPYLLSGLVINKPNQAWQVDITYLKTKNGFMYLIALIDVYTRVIVGWHLSNDMDAASCIIPLERAVMQYGIPEIVNSDQGAQFTSDKWIKYLNDNNIKVSMTGKGRSNDNANIERLWRSLKYEGSYLYKWSTVVDLKVNLPKWIDWYNYQRPHQALGYKTPIETYCEFMHKSYDLHTTSQYQLQYPSDSRVEENVSLL